MPDSSLLAALLGGQSGNNASMLALDPNAMSDIQTGQSLQQAGMSTQPAYLGTAIGRLAQALSGTYLKQSGVSELGKAINGGVEGMKDLFPQDSVIGKGLRSDNPLVRVMSFQQIPTAIKMNSGGAELGPATQYHPFAGSAVSAENTEPRSGQGQMAEEIDRLRKAGQPQLADALSRAMSKEGYFSSGVPAPTIPSEPAPRPTGAGATPSAAIPAPPAPPSPSPSSQALAQRAQAANTGGVTPPSPTGVPGQQPPPAPPSPQSEPAPATSGNPAPQSVANQIAGAMQTQEASKTAAKEFVEKDTPAFASTQNLLGRLDVIDHDINQLGPSWMGAGADTKASLAKAWNSTLDTAGIAGHHIDPTKIATWEDFNKETIRGGMELIKSNFGGSREAASIIQMGKTAFPNVEGTYLGQKYVSATVRAAAQASSDLYNYKKQLMDSGKSIVGAEGDFYKQHPPQQYMMGAITSQIPAPAVSYLKANPNTALHFDQKFGSGTAEFLLGAK